MNRLKKPIVFIGPGRTGSSIIFRAISLHQDLGWLSNYNYLLKRIPQIGFAHRILPLDAGEKYQGQKVSVLNKILPKPLEVYPVWEILCGSSFRYGSLHELEPDDTVIKNTRHYFNQMLKWQGKNRLILKITGPPRISYLSKIFPDLYIVDIQRHPLGVINSYMNVDFWNKKGVDKPHWEDFFSEGDFKTWKKYNKSKLVLATLEWKKIVSLTNQEVTKTNLPFLRIKYEDFVNNPINNARQILRFCELSDSSNVINYIIKTTYKSANEKYLKNFSTEEKETVRNIISKELSAFDYKA